MAAPRLGEPAELRRGLVVLDVGRRQQTVERGVAAGPGGHEVCLVLGCDGDTHPQPGDDRGELVHRPLRPGPDGRRRRWLEQVVHLLHQPGDGRPLERVEACDVGRGPPPPLATEPPRHQESLWNVAQRP